MHIIQTVGAVVTLLTCVVAQDPPKPQPPAPAPAPADKPIGIGDALPKGIALRGIDGKLQALDDLRGKIVVLHFWSTTCPSEVVAEPKINALSAEFADKGVVVLGIAANANEFGGVPEAKEFETTDPEKMPFAKLRAKAKESKCNHGILVDVEGQVARLLDAKTTPHCFVFDKEGKLQYTGALDDDERGKKEGPLQYVRNAVTALQAGEKPGVSITKPYG